MKRKALALVLALALVCALSAAALAAEGFEETVLCDAGGVTVTVTGYEPEGTWGPAFVLSLKNGSRRDVKASLDLVSVNGVMCDPKWKLSLPAGKTAESRVEWYAGDLANVGVDWIDEVDALLTVRPSDGDDVFFGTVRWSAPAGTGPAVTEPVFDSGFEPVAVSQGDLAVTAVDYDPDGEDGPAVLFRVENGSDKDLWLHMGDARANGVLSEPYWSVTAAAGKTAYGWCRWDGEDLAGSGIDALREVSFTMEAVDWHTLETLDEKEASLTLPAPAAPAPAAAPAGTPAPEADAPAVMGKVKLDRYENPYFGLAFEPGEDWHFMTEEELRAMQSMSAALLRGTDAEGYMDTVAGGYAAAATSRDGRMNVTMMVQRVQGLAEAADQDSFLDLVLGDVETDENGNMTIPGMENASVRRDTVTLAGRDLPALTIETDGAIGMTVHQQQVYAVRGDWFLQISLTSLRDDGGLEEMAAFFAPLPE